jgi:hypothetical protein
MLVGRRRYLLPVAFLVIAACFTSASVARAQAGNEPHTLWNKKLTPEQIKAALSKLSLGNDENGPLHKMLREHMLQRHPELSKELVDAIIKKALSEPGLLEKAAKQAQEKQTDPGRPPRFDRDDLDKLAKSITRNDLPKDLPPGVKIPGESPKPPTVPPTPTSKPPLEGKRPTDPGIPELPKVTVKPQAAPPQVEPVPRPAQPVPPGAMGPAPQPQPLTPEDTLFRPPDEPTDPRTSRSRPSRRSGNAISDHSTKRPR